MAAPGVVGSERGAAARLQRASEIGLGERDHALIDTHFRGRGVESVERLADLQQTVALIRQLQIMGIETAQIGEEYLTVDAQCRAYVDDLGDLRQLVAERCIRKHGSQRRRTRQRLVQRRGLAEPVGANRVGGLHQRQPVVEAHQVLQSGKPG